METEYYDDIIIGSGKAGKTLAPALVADGRKTALVERSLNMIGGGCINIACIPTKKMVASANVANIVKNSATYGVKANAPIVELADVIRRKREVVQSMHDMNLHNLETALGHELIIGTGRFVAPKIVEVIADGQICRGIKNMKNPMNLEPALCPEDLAKFFILRANAGDVEGLVALYEPDAILACGDGQTVIGSEAIRRFYTELLATRPQFTPGEQASPLQNGDVALTSSRLGNGNVTAEVARRQSNGMWLWAVDQPVISLKL
jgi:ketosteroid isomerase-like protein